MARRTKRILGQHEQEAFLAQAGEWRRACIAMRAKAPVGEPFMRALDQITAGIDSLAEVVTGKRDHFHLKPHGSAMLSSTFGDYATPREREKGAPAEAGAPRAVGEGEG